MDIPEPRLQIEPMSLETVEAVEALEQECFSTPWSLDALVEELSNPLAVFYTATLDGELAGYVGMHHIIDEGYITNLAVTASRRRQGVASALLEKVIAYAQENDLRTITLEVRPSNQAALGLYRAYQFQEAGSRKDYYRSPTEHALLLTRKM